MQLSKPLKQSNPTWLYSVIETWKVESSLLLNTIAGQAYRLTIEYFATKASVSTSFLYDTEPS